MTHPDQHQNPGSINHDLHRQGQLRQENRSSHREDKRQRDNLARAHFQKTQLLLDADLGTLTIFPEKTRLLMDKIGAFVGIKMFRKSTEETDGVLMATNEFLNSKPMPEERRLSLAAFMAFGAAFYNLPPNAITPSLGYFGTGGEAARNQRLFEQDLRRLQDEYNRLNQPERNLIIHFFRVYESLFKRLFQSPTQDDSAKQFVSQTPPDQQEAVASPDQLKPLRDQALTKLKAIFSAALITDTSLNFYAFGQQEFSLIEQELRNTSLSREYTLSTIETFLATFGSAVVANGGVQELLRLNVMIRTYEKLLNLVTPGPVEPDTLGSALTDNAGGNISTEDFVAQMNASPEDEPLQAYPQGDNSVVDDWDPSQTRFDRTQLTPAQKTPPFGAPIAGSGGGGTSDNTQLNKAWVDGFTVPNTPIQLNHPTALPPFLGTQPPEGNIALEDEQAQLEGLKQNTRDKLRLFANANSLSPLPGNVRMLDGALAQLATLQASTDMTERASFIERTAFTIINFGNMNSIQALSNLIQTTK